MNTSERLFDLTIFAGEGGGEGGGADGAAAGAQAGADAEAAAAQDAARREAFETSFNEYKDLYQEKLQKQLSQRMKSHDRESAALKTENQRYQALAQSLANRYGVDPADLEGITKAVDDDSSWLEEMAAKNGLTVEQQRHMNQLTADNARMMAERAEAERQRQADATLAAWRQEAEAVKQTFPDFDLDAEAQNPDFARLLQSNVPMQTAYQVVHMDELMQSGMQYAVQRTASNMAANIRANGLRPTEGAGKGTAPTKIALDVNKLTKEQRAELIKRAERGEEIGFG